MANEAGSDSAAELTALMPVLAGLKLLPKRFSGRVPLKELEHEVLLLVYNPQRLGSVRELGVRIRRLISIARDRFSVDTWRILNELQSDSRVRPGRIPLANALALLNRLIIDLAAFSGIEMENMTRGHGWRFLDFGRRLERGANLVNLLSSALSAKTNTSVLLEPLLEIADSSITYRRRYLAQAQLPSLIELLVLDHGNPRSLAFQLHALTEHAAHLPDYGDASIQNPEQRHLGQLFTHLQKFSIAELARLEEKAQKESLLQWL